MIDAQKVIDQLGAQIGQLTAQLTIAQVHIAQLESDFCAEKVEAQVDAG